MDSESHTESNETMHVNQFITDLMQSIDHKIRETKQIKQRNHLSDFELFLIIARCSSILSSTYSEKALTEMEGILSVNSQLETISKQQDQ